MSTGIPVGKVITAPPVCGVCGKTDKVAVGWCNPETVSSEWVNSLLVAVGRGLTGRCPHIVGFLQESASGGHVATGRCQIVQGFLDLPGRPEWLWMQDADATYDAFTLERLLAAANPVTAPIVGGLAFGVVARSEAVLAALPAGAFPFHWDLFPTLYRTRPDGQLARMESYDRDTMVAVDATGCHCLLIHRSVLEDPRWDRNHPLPWFRSDVSSAGKEISEDVFFCSAARSMGFPIFVHTGIRTGHVKPFIATEALYLAQQAERAPAYQATAPLAIVVPTRARPVQAAELVEAWRATTEGLSEIIFCVDDDDTSLGDYPPAGDGVHILTGSPAQLVKWTNRVGVPLAPHCRGIVSWGDDHRPRTLWESATLAAFDDGAHFVYGDDLLHGSALPTACAVSSAAVAALGYVAPPGLVHLYCDNFWVRLGQMTGTLRYLPDVVVEHVHPAAGKAEWDDSYRASNAPDAYARDQYAFAVWLSVDAARDAACIEAIPAKVLV